MTDRVVFAQRDLVAEGERVVRDNQEGFPTVVSAGPNADGSALQVTVLTGTLERVRKGGVPLALLLGTRFPIDVSEGDFPVAL